MLQELYIQNLAVIERVRLQFVDGFNVLTGETGAGKSIIIRAVDLLLGGRALSDYIRSGEDRTLIEGVFLIVEERDVLERLVEAGIEPEEQALIITREIRRGRNNRAMINDRRVTTGLLRELRPFLVDIHSQNEDQILLRPTHQLDLLDAYAGEEHLGVKEAYRKVHKSLQEVRERVEELERGEREKAREMDLLEYEFNEIEQAGISEEEFEELETRRNILRNLETLRESLGEAFHLLEGEGGQLPPICDRMAEVVTCLRRAAEIEPGLDPLLDTGQDIAYSLSELAVDIRGRMDDFHSEPGELEELEDRLETFHHLMRKYGETIEEILNYRDRVRRRLKELKNREKLTSDLNDRLEELERELLEVGQNLSRGRREAAEKLKVAVEAELEDLMMEDTRFSVSFQDVEQPAPQGMERLDFMISPNPGEQPRSLRDTASGGEVSRIMLALKTILAGLGGVSSLVFDEIDVGIGGQAGTVVARKMVDLAERHQLLCITHLPQMASLADRHFLVSKEFSETSTRVEVEAVEGEERIRELARMLGGQELPDTTFDHARAILEEAEDIKERKG